MCNRDAILFMQMIRRCHRKSMVVYVTHCDLPEKACSSPTVTAG